MTDEMPWRAQYESGVPGEIDTSRVVPLPQYLSDTASRYPDLPAFTNFGVSMTYAELDRDARRLAGKLRDEYGLAPGDRAAIMLPNILQFPVAMFAILRAGLTVVNVNPLYTPRELRHQLVDSGARAIFILENFAHVLEAVVDDTRIEHVVVTRVGDYLPGIKGMMINAVLKYVKKAVPAYSLPGAHTWQSLMEGPAGVDHTDHAVDLDDVAFLQYTGGTTGLSKGAVLTHRNVSSNIQQGLEWSAGRFKPGEEVAITALPLYHIFALTGNLWFMVAVGGNCVLITNPRDFKGFVKELGKWQMTYITGVNTLYSALLETPGFDKVDFSNLKIALGAGMAVTRPVARRWFEVTGKPLIEVYGLSETSPAVCMNRLDLDAFNGYIGLPISSTEVIVADDNGQPVDTEAEGELCIRGPQVMREYWNAPDATEAAFTRDGYFRTGDYATINSNGYVKILDRKKDMILVSGFNVYPNEIEDTVGDHPGVREVAALGIPDERSGERVMLYVVRRGDELKAEDLIAWCRENMTNYKVPKEVSFVPELPKTAVGKILRRALRDD